MRNPSVTQPMFRTLKKPVSFAARSLLGTITGVETGEPVLALTFDDGPHPEYTPRLLEVLDKYQAKATFFCIGKYAARHPELVRQTVEAGHAIGNHTWDHPSLPLLAQGERREQIRACADALCPYGSRLFRPPYGHQSLASRIDLLRLGYQVVGYTQDSKDWRLTEPDGIAGQLFSSLRPGSIIAFHDRLAASLTPVHFDRAPMIEAVELLFQRIRGSYQFLTLPQLFRLGTLVRENWYRRADASQLNAQIEEGNVPGRQYPVLSDTRIDAPYFM